MPSVSRVASSGSSTSSSQTFFSRLVMGVKMISPDTVPTTPAADKVEEWEEAEYSIRTTSPVTSEARNHVLTAADLDYIDQALKKLLRDTDI